MEKLTIRKMAGCLMGLAGVILVELTPAGFAFRLAGDGLVALSALCYGVSSSMIKRYSSEHDTVLFSGWQFIFGGIVMTAVGLICGGRITVINKEGVLDNGQYFPNNEENNYADYEQELKSIKSERRRTLKNYKPY